MRRIDKQQEGRGRENREAKAEERVEQWRPARRCGQPSPVNETDLRDHNRSSGDLRATTRLWLDNRKPNGRLKDRGYSSPGQQGRGPKKFVDGASALAAFPNGPDHERLAAAHVAGGEEFRDRGTVIDRARADIAAEVEVNSRLFNHAGDARTQEPHGQQHQVGLQREVAVWDFLHDEAAIRAPQPVEAYAFEFRNAAGLTDSALCQYRPIALTTF